MALAVLAPLLFVTKPYTIDDPIFLGEARHLLTHPLHPTAFELVWNQERSQHASAFLPGGPRAGCLLVPIAVVGARSAWPVRTGSCGCWPGFGLPARWRSGPPVGTAGPCGLGACLGQAPSSMLQPRAHNTVPATPSLVQAKRGTALPSGQKGRHALEHHAVGRTGALGDALRPLCESSSFKSNSGRLTAPLPRAQPRSPFRRFPSNAQLAEARSRLRSRSGKRTRSGRLSWF